MLRFNTDTRSIKKRYYKEAKVQNSLQLHQSLLNRVSPHDQIVMHHQSDNAEPANHWEI